MGLRISNTTKLQVISSNYKDILQLETFKLDMVLKVFVLCNKKKGF